MSPSVCSSGRYKLVKMFITLEPHGIFGSNFAYACMSTLSNHCAQQPILMDVALLSIGLDGRGQLVKMLTILEPHGIFGTNLHTYLS